MIFSSNQDHNIPLFNDILQRSLSILNKEAQLQPEVMKKLAGTPLEKHVADIMAIEASDTEFENTIECLGGISFPDIIANNYFGVEVKTTVKDHWKTTGNSVLESTRRKDIEKIFMLFGKLGGHVEFRYRPYEECLSEVVVTHSPRYQIDMNLEPNKTIFDKIEIPYEVLRKKDNPIRSIVEYYKKGLKPGDELWWIDPSHAEPVSLVIRLWGNLSPAEKNQYVIKSMVYFPELIGKSNWKYNRLAVWLSTAQGVVCPNIRDNFSAGGRGDLVVNGNLYRDVPQIFLRLFEKRDQIAALLNDSDPLELAGYWGSTEFSIHKLDEWIQRATFYSKEILPEAYYGLIADIFRDLDNISIRQIKMDI